MDTKNEDIPWMVVLPTVEEPGFTEPANIGRAMSALLKILIKHPELQPCYCPFLGTGVGGVDEVLAARKMVMADRDWITQYIRDIHSNIS